MTYEYTAYVSSGNVNSGNEVLRVTAEGEFIWNEHADEMIESGDYSQYPALRHILKALREAERIKAENERLRGAVTELLEAARAPGGDTYGKAWLDLGAALRREGTNVHG